TREPLASQSAQLEELFSRIGARQDLQDAMATLDLSGVWTTLVTADTTFNTLYDQRLEEQASAAAPSATSIKDTVVKDYDDLCTTVEQTISTLPSPALELLFGQMDLLRKKYAARHPSKLDPSVTTVEPIPAQAYTGRPVTPLPRVFFKTGEQTIELHFAQDFTVTYNNNVEIGEATLIIHGKGQYSGQRITTFYIVGSEA
ncbi:MAG: DUF6261 family protein, partial [Prevotellaceae bacterium]|nr:DUF6261 family protein [Prevotellaceae bacterium]